MTARRSLLLTVLAYPGALSAQNIAEVQVAPPSVTIRIGERSGLLATAFDRAGNVIPTVRIIWSSNNVAVARVDNNGTVTGVGGGVAIVEARAGTRKGQAAVQVVGAVAALAPGQGTVQVTSSSGLTATAPVVVQQSDIAIQEPIPLVMSPGDVDTLHVVVPAQGGRLVSPLALQWSAADPSVARVSLTGVVSAVAPGRTALNVVGLLQTKPVDILVHKTVEALTVFPTSKTDLPLPIQGTVKFQVQALAADKSPVPEAPFRWTVGDTSLASFDPASGTLTGKRAGKTTLVVKGPGPGLVVTWQIRVIAAGLKLSAARLGLPLNRRYPLKANFADEAGVIIGPATGVTWTSDNPQVVAVTEDGTVSTASYGHAHITAMAPGGRRAAAEVFVQGEIVEIGRASCRERG